MWGAKLTDEQITEMLVLYGSGEWRLNELGQRFGVYGTSVRYHLRKHGMKIISRPVHPRVPGEKVRAIRALGKTNLLTREIAARTGATPYVTRTILREEGRSRLNGQAAFPLDPEIVEEILRLYATGRYSVRALAKKFGTSRTRVHSTILRNGGVGRKTWKKAKAA